MSKVIKPDKTKNDHLRDRLVTRRPEPDSNHGAYLASWFDACLSRMKKQDYFIAVIVDGVEVFKGPASALNTPSQFFPFDSGGIERYKALPDYKGNSKPLYFTKNAVPASYKSPYIDFTQRTDNNELPGSPAGWNIPAWLQQPGMVNVYHSPAFPFTGFVPAVQNLTLWDIQMPEISGMETLGSAHGVARATAITPIAATENAVENWTTIENIPSRILQFNDQMVDLECIIDADQQVFENRSFETSLLSSVIPLQDDYPVMLQVYKRPGEVRLKFIDGKGVVNEELFNVDYFKDFPSSLNKPL